MLQPASTRTRKSALSEETQRTFEMRLSADLPEFRVAFCLN